MLIYLRTMSTLHLPVKSVHLSSPASVASAPIVAREIKNALELPNFFYMSTLVGIALEQEIRTRIKPNALPGVLVAAGLTPKMFEDVIYGRYELGVGEMFRLFHTADLGHQKFCDRVGMYIQEVTQNRGANVIFTGITPITDRTPRSLVVEVLHGEGSLYARKKTETRQASNGFYVEKVA